MNPSPDPVSPEKPVGQAIAVYGSLMRSEGMLSQLRADALLRYIGPAVIPGRLFDLGEFPGVTAGTGIVPAELFEILDRSVLRILDDYEAFNPDSPSTSLFVRRPVRLIDPAMDAWVYFYNGRTDGCPTIEGVSWPEYKSRRQAPIHPRQIDAT